MKYYHDDGDNNVLFWRKEVQFVAGRVIRVPRGLRALLFSRCPRDCAVDADDRDYNIIIIVVIV